MLSQTRRALEDFDNQHDFERMAADTLNALGYSGVEPQAPGGGSDFGQDIKFREGDAPGIAFVTLDKNIKTKFNQDLAKQHDGEGVIALFCNVDVSPSTKMDFTKEAISKGYRLEVFDLERLRSLLDSSLTAIRRRYLKIDDEVAARLRQEVRKLLRFPDAIPDQTTPPTLIEKLLADKQPRRLFELLMQFEERDIIEVPGIGEALHNQLTTYYQFRKEVLRVETDLLSRIGPMAHTRITAGWHIYLKYAVMRFDGMAKDSVIAGGDFLNYGITWDDAERVFVQLSAVQEVSSEVLGLFTLYKRLREQCQLLGTS